MDGVSSLKGEPLQNTLKDLPFENPLPLLGEKQLDEEKFHGEKQLSGPSEG